ncbi:inactive dipeptidyl peptidase 10 isoform X2 [Planococcus citri]|uniref:inactive dipeptidyl peptidase 10 isoform X2 n=1 Tax=Planococcus citri TaxID=170843 RepID=UPI0031F8138B
MFSREAQGITPNFKEHHSIKDLAYAGLSDGQYWRSVMLALLVIALVIGGIASAILTYGFVDELLYWSGQRLTLDDLLRGDLFPKRLPSMWVSSTGFVYQTDDGSLSLFNTTTNNVTNLVSNYTLSHLDVKEYACSNDLKYILLKHNLNQVFKNTYTAHYTIYTVSNDHQTPLMVNGSDVKISELQSVSWAGNTNNLILVENNDIYVKYEINHREVRITSTGVPGVIYNGVPDWLYQEEILPDTEKTYWVSTDGSHLLYASFNDSIVQNLEYPWLQDDMQNKDLEKFPATKSVRYPTPGTHIPDVKLWIVNISFGNETYQSIEINHPPSFQGQDFYLTSAGWVNDKNSRISAIWMSRVQNFSIVCYCEAPSWKCVEQHIEQAPNNMWLEIQHHPVFAPDGQSYLLLAPVQENGIHYYTQIKHVTLEDKHILTISHGHYEVLQILAWDTINHIVYYIGSDAENTGKQHLYSINDQTFGETVRPETLCITCGHPQHYENCSHFSAYFAPIIWNSGIEYYVLECNGPSLPTAGIHYTFNHTLRKILFDVHQAKASELKKFALPTSMFESVPLSKGYTARVQLLLPPSWRPELRDAAFPVIIQVNGRPNSQSVSTKSNPNWGIYMSSRKGVIYIQLDVRGSKGQSTEDLYKRLGDIEVEDQITVIKKLMQDHKYLDKNRIGVWGWGYGGYVTTMLMGSQYRLFKCGIAVSPIADWSYYNSAFTEKILGLKTESNNIGYVEADIKSKTKFIASNSFYIIQGLADLSVPYQHGIMLAKALTRSKVLFQHQMYANEGHELNGVLSHMYRSMEDYFTQRLALEEDDLQNHI